MSAAAANAHDRNDGPRSPWLRHHATRLIITVLVLDAVVELLVGNSPIGTVVYITALSFAIAMNVRHQMAICDRCIADWPLDGSRVAETRAFSPWYFHWQYTPFGLICELVGMGSILVVTNIVTSGTLSRLVSASVLLTVALHFYLIGRHHGLEPWCPGCRGNGGWGDDEEHTPTPTPLRTESH